MSATPIERATHAAAVAWASQGSWDAMTASAQSNWLAAFRPVALAVFGSLDRDEVIEFLNSPQHAPDGTHSQADGSCSECPWPLYALPPDRIADALIEFLLGGAS